MANEPEDIEGQKKATEFLHKILDEQKRERDELVNEFCEYAGLQNNSDAKMPNIICGIKVYMDHFTPWWDPLDDYSLVSPEFLYYILKQAQEFWHDKSSSD